MSLDVLCCDEIGQISSELISIIDIIMRRLRESNIFLGGILLICTLDHTQIQPIKQSPFLTSSHILPCFKMVELTRSVRASGDQVFERIQQIVRLPYQSLMNQPTIVDEFVTKVSESFTFVSSWSSPLIEADTFRLYGKRVPAREAIINFVQRIQNTFSPSDVRQSKAVDLVKSRHSVGEWIHASQAQTQEIDHQSKEPHVLLFFRGAKFEFTYNCEGQFSQSKFGLLYDLPQQQDLDRWKPLKVLAAPPGIQDVTFNPSQHKQFYINMGFTEVKVGPYLDRTKQLKNAMQGKRKIYGLKHRVTGTIHTAMADTLTKVATEISVNDLDFCLWGKGQLVVLLSRTKFVKDTIFVGNKQDTINGLKTLLLQRTQWSDYMDHVLSVVTVNQDNDTPQSRTMIQTDFPFRIRDLQLPQCRTGFVYMLILLNRDFCYIGETICIRQRLRQHNSGYGSNSTCPSYLRPFARMAYICGFTGENQKRLRRQIEHLWKIKRNYLISHGQSDPRVWARSGEEIIADVTSDRTYHIDESTLRLVCLFRSTESMNENDEE